MGKQARLNAARRAAGAGSESQPVALEASPSAAPRAAEFDLRALVPDKYDDHFRTRLQLGAIARKAGEWAGIPMSLENERLVVHPSYRWAHIIEKPPPGKGSGTLKVRNFFWSKRFRVYVHVCEREDGKCVAIPALGTGNTVDMELRTMGCSCVWGLEQESTALKLLSTLVEPHKMELYLLTGQFLETSRRSGVTYLFRKLRPTVAMKEIKGSMSILACLCLHPIGYYNESWAGAMCPTDDVIAHLMLMRGDEHRYWKDANQIPAGRPTSGIGVG